jgi:hypothetical protein
MSYELPSHYIYGYKRDRRQINAAKIAILYNSLIYFHTWDHIIDVISFFKHIFNTEVAIESN